MSTTEQNKALVRRFYEEVFNQGKYEVLDEITASNFDNHSPNNPPGLPNGREGQRQLVMLYRNAYPDVHFTIEDIIAEGDLVVCRWSATGTMTGELLGIPATNRRGSITGTDIERIENGKLAEAWGIFDQLGLLQQMGVIPAPGARPAQTKSQTTGTTRGQQQPPARM